MAIRKLIRLVQGMYRSRLVMTNCHVTTLAWLGLLLHGTEVMHILLKVMILKLTAFINYAVCRYGQRARTNMALRLSAVHHASTANALSGLNSCGPTLPFNRTFYQAASSAAMSAVPPEPSISRAYPDEPRVRLLTVRIV